MREIIVCTAMVAILALAGVVHYLLALAGEPRALWIWRDVLGIIKTR